MASSNSDNLSFICSTGKLLWGQLHCIIEGHLADSSAADATAPSPSANGTIIQHDFHYVVSAVPGEWRVKDLNFVESEPEGQLVGFIIYNKETADPVEILKECATLGMRSSKDNRIVYVNRYDWGWAHQTTDAVEHLLFGGDITDELEDKIRNLTGQRIIVADASGCLAVVDQMKKNVCNTPDRRRALIKETLKDESGAIGVHLACPNTEYELGWMMFNEKRELIAFVYDGAYTGLEGDISVKN